VLGRTTADGGLALRSAVTAFRCNLDTRRAVIRCPERGAEREFRGKALVLGEPSGVVPRGEPNHLHEDFT
jgi:hypothetical protein